jgi:hypothetical protein
VLFAFALFAGVLSAGVLTTLRRAGAEAASPTKPLLVRSLIAGLLAPLLDCAITVPLTTIKPATAAAISGAIDLNFLSMLTSPDARPGRALVAARRRQRCRQSTCPHGFNGEALPPCCGPLQPLSL